MSDCLCDESAGSPSAIHSDCDFDPHRNIELFVTGVRERETERDKKGVETCGDRRQEGGWAGGRSGGQKCSEGGRGSEWGACTTCSLSPSLRLEPFMYSFFGRTSSCSGQSLKTVHKRVLELSNVAHGLAPPTLTLHIHACAHSHTGCRCECGERSSERGE